MAKMNEKLIVLLILGLLVNQHRVNCFVGMAVSLVSFAWSAFEVYNSIEDTYLKHTTPSTAELMQKSDEIAVSLDDWGTRIEQKIQETMDTLITRLPLMGRIDADVQLLNSYIGRINELYGDLKLYLQHPKLFSNEALRDMVEIFTSRAEGAVQDTISKMNNLIVPKLGNLKKSIFLLLAEEIQILGLKLCDTNSSPQQRLIDFYNMAMESEMKAFAMIGFGYSMDAYFHNESMTADIKRAQVKLLVRAKEYLLVLKNTLGQAATQFRRCDPPYGHQRGL